MAKYLRSTCLLLALTVPLALTGCNLFGNSSQQPINPPSNNQTTTPPANSFGNGSTDTNSNSGSSNSGTNTNSSGGSNQGGSGSGNSGSGGSDNSNQNGSSNPFPSGGTGSVSTSTAPSLVMYAPVLVGENLVKLSGKVSNQSNSSTKVAVFAGLYGGNQIASAYAPVANDGTFQITLNVTSAGAGEQLLYFHASYSGAITQGQNDYLNIIPIIRRSALMDNVLEPVYRGVQWMASKTQVDIRFPDWLTQQLSGGKTDAPYISVKAAAKTNTYTMQFYNTPAAYPINDSRIGQSPYDAPGYVIGHLTGTSYSSNSEALQRVALLAPPATSGTDVTLGNVHGYLYHGETTAVRWQEGLWTLQVEGPDDAQDIATARQIVNDLNAWYLPPTTGSILVRHVWDSTRTTYSTYTDVSYAIGTNVYQIHTDNRLDDALHITASMKM
jgi:hypothetical protein